MKKLDQFLHKYGVMGWYYTIAAPVNNRDCHEHLIKKAGVLLDELLEALKEYRESRWI